MNTKTIKKLYRTQEKNYTVTLAQISGDIFQVTVHTQDHEPKTGTLVIKKHDLNKNELFFELNKQLLKAHVAASNNKSYAIQLCNTNSQYLVQSLQTVIPAYGLPKINPALQTHIPKTQTHTPAQSSDQNSNCNFSHQDSQLLGQNTLKAPLAGKIIKILAKNNQSVTINQPIVIIESMKMENEICAPYDATIKTLPICTGDLVKVGQVLMVFEKT
ncbi:MAG: acetyl-CoA carboxylase biotin carboxyl carrier protein subunit [bacterium]